MVEEGLAAEYEDKSTKTVNNVWPSFVSSTRSGKPVRSELVTSLIPNRLLSLSFEELSLDSRSLALWFSISWLFIPTGSLDFPFGSKFNPPLGSDELETAGFFWTMSMCSPDTGDNGLGAAIRSGSSSASLRIASSTSSSSSSDVLRVSSDFLLVIREEPPGGLRSWSIGITDPWSMTKRELFLRPIFRLADPARSISGGGSVWGIGVDSFGRGSRLVEDRWEGAERVGVLSMSVLSSSDSRMRVITSAGGLAKRTVSRGGWTGEVGSLRLSGAIQTIWGAIQFDWTKTHTTTSGRCCFRSGEIQRGTHAG